MNTAVARNTGKTEMTMAVVEDSPVGSYFVPKGTIDNSPETVKVTNATRCGTLQFVGRSTYTPFRFWHPQNDNLHHGPFLFRHKGKKKKGKPNYPPTKLLVKTRRQWRKKLPRDIKLQIRADLRRARRNWTEAVKANNDELRPQRVRKRALRGDGELINWNDIQTSKPLLFEPGGMFRESQSQ